MTKKIFFALLFATGLTRLVAWLNRNKITILAYHGVTKIPVVSADDRYKLHLPFNSFVEQLDYLQSHYRLISFEQLVKAHSENKRLPGNTALLTFDDGYRNFLTVVAPLLLERGIPATSFIITGENFTQESSTLNGNWTSEDDHSYLSWSEVRELVAKGLDFGSHTSSHAPLPDISLSDARWELESSLNSIKSKLGLQSIALSYPFGLTSEGIICLAQSLGYSCAVTAVLGQNNRGCDLFALRRIIIASDDDLPTFAARAAGMTSWYHQVADFFRMRLPRAPKLTERSQDFS